MFFKKQKRIKELELSEDRLKIENDRLRKEIKELKEKISGGRVPSIYCERCANSLRDPFGIGRYGCILNCKCKDFKDNNYGQE